MFFIEREEALGMAHRNQGNVLEKYTFNPYS